MEGTELEQALALVAEAVRSRHPLNHYHARAVLLPLGLLLTELDDRATQEAVSRVATAVAPVRKAWERAVREELELAIAEFVRAVDETYLARPDYDFTYTMGARKRLADRLRAADALSIDPPADWLRPMERADHVLAPYLARSTGRSSEADS